MVISNIVPIPTNVSFNALLSIDRFGQPDLPVSSGAVTFAVYLDLN
jgi:hypothetical protein